MDRPGRMTNIDTQEIATFAALADQWWDRKGELKALHDINPVRLAYVRERCKLAGQQVLDVGCGGGLLAEAIAREGAVVTGIDMGSEALSVAKIHANANRLEIEYHQSTAEQWVRGHEAAYDTVTCMELLEHVPDPASLVHACSALTQPGGSVFFGTVNRTWLSRLLVIWASEYILRIVRKGTHHYSKFVKPEELILWGEQAGLQMVNLSGLRYLPFIGHSSLCTSTRMNYLLHFKKLPSKLPDRNRKDA